MNKPVATGIVILVLIVFAVVSIWSLNQADDIQGPMRLVQGPENTIYILVDNRIVKASANGDVIHTYNLDEMYIHEPVADFFVEPNGDLLVGLQLSQEIELHTADGLYHHTVPRPPSPVSSEGGRDFRFTIDPGSGNLFVSDTFYNRLQVYGPEGKEIRTITAALGQNLRSPSGIVPGNGRIYLADRDNLRILVLSGDGTPIEEIPIPRSRSAKYDHPLRVSIQQARIYVTTRAQIPLAGREVRMITPEAPNQIEADIDPEDLLARTDDLLVADLQSMSVLRYSHDGALLGPFGRESFNKIVRVVQWKRRVYEWGYYGSIGGMGLILIGLALLLRQKKATAPTAETVKMEVSQGRLARLLGPVGGLRRRALIILVPGLGQAAAGKGLRAFLVILALVLLLSFFALSYWLANVLGLSSVMPLLLTAMVCLMLAFWVGIAVDAILLADLGKRLPGRFGPKGIIQIFGLPLITVLAGLFAQSVWEWIIYAFPEVSVSINDIFRQIMIRLDLADPSAAVFAAIPPTAMFLGWGGAMAGLFGTLAWHLRMGAVKTALAIGMGFGAGIFSWLISATFVRTLVGGAFYQYPVLGGFIGLSAYLFFIRCDVSALIIPAAASAAWLGDIAGLLANPSLLRLSAFAGGVGSITRMALTAFPAYFIHLAIHLVIVAFRAEVAADVSIPKPSSKTSRKAVAVGLAVLGIVVAGAAGWIFFPKGTAPKKVVAEEDYAMDLAHINITHFEERSIGFQYAWERLLAAGGKAVPSLSQAVDSTEPEFHEQMKNLLFRLPKTEAVNEIWIKMDRFGKKRMERLRKYDGRPEWPAIREMVFDATIDWDVRSRAIEELIKKDQFHVAELEPLLKSNSIDDQKSAVTAINKLAFLDYTRGRINQMRGESGTRGKLPVTISESDQTVLVPLLSKLVRSSDTAVVRRAALAIGWFGQPQQAVALLDVLPKAPPLVQEAIIIALAELKDPKAVGRLNELLQDGGTPYVRATAASALESFKDPSSINPLIAAFSDSVWLVRYHAAHTLAQYEDPETVAAFDRLTNDENPTVRSEAKLVTDKLGHGGYAPLFEASPAPPGQPQKKYIIGKDRELAAIWKETDQAVRSDGGSKKQAEALVAVIDRVEKLRKKKSDARGMDRLLFLSGRAKSHLASFYLTELQNSAAVKAYIGKHRADFKDGEMGEGRYLGADYEEIMKRFPKSPLNEEAAFAMAGDRTNGFHCEESMDCEIYMMLEAYAPFMKQYPSSPRILGVINWINAGSLGEMLNDGGGWDEPEDSTPLLLDYYETVKTLSDSKARMSALRPLARAFISLGRYDRADDIYKDLLTHYPDLPNRDVVRRSADRMFDHWRPIPESNFYNRYVDGLISDSESKQKETLEEISREEKRTGPALLSGVLLAVADRIVVGKSPEVRHRAIEVTGKMAPKTARIQMALLSCMTKDPDLENRYLCAVHLKSFQAALSKEQVVQKAIEKVEAEYRAKKQMK